MIVGLKENVPFILKSVPERNIDGKWNKIANFRLFENFEALWF